MARSLAGEWLRVVTGRRQLCLPAGLRRLMEADLAGLAALQPCVCWCSRVNGVGAKVRSGGRRNRLVPVAIQLE